METTLNLLDAWLSSQGTQASCELATLGIGDSGRSLS